MTHTTPVTASPSTDADADSLHQQVNHVIERLRPTIQADGGDLTLVAVTDAGVVQIRLHGACIGCPSSSMTLKMGIEKNLVGHVPGIVAVEQVP